MPKTFHGGCHCGAVKFEATLDLEGGETSRCNCSICLKQRFWKCVIPAADFNLIKGEADLSIYTFGAGKIEHMFCSACGVKPFGKVEIDAVPMIAVNVATLDDASDAEWANAPVVFQDGRHDRWENVPRETGFL